MSGQRVARPSHNQQHVIAFAPATIANLNIGFDVLGLALESPQEKMIIEQSTRSGVCIKQVYTLHRGQRRESHSLLPMTPDLNVAGRSALSVLDAIKSVATDQLGQERSSSLPLGIELTIEKSILPGSGIGSSAASAVAATIGVNTFLGAALSEEQLLSCALDGEELASGARHYDNVAPALRGGLSLSSPNGEVLRIPAPDWTLVILHPQVQVKTAEARAVLPTHIPLSTVSKAIGWMGTFINACHARDARAAAFALHDLYVGPARSPLIPALQRCRATAEQAGAISGGISGSGPSTFWVCLDHQSAVTVQHALHQEMSALQIPCETYISRISERGAYALLQSK